MAAQRKIAASSAAISQASKVPGNSGIACKDSIRTAKDAATAITFNISLLPKGFVIRSSADKSE